MPHLHGCLLTQCELETLSEEYTHRNRSQGDAAQLRQYRSGWERAHDIGEELEDCSCLTPVTKISKADLKPSITVSRLAVPVAL